jgi:hypothetical protein
VIAHPSDHSVDLKRRPPKSLLAALVREKPKPSPIEEAARKDSAVHVSLSSDSPVKQPGNLAVSTLRNDRKADEA